MTLGFFIFGFSWRCLINKEEVNPPQENGILNLADIGKDDSTHTAAFYINQCFTLKSQDPQVCD